MYLEPTLINGHDALRLSLRIGCGDADYALKNISRFVADMRTGTYESYGKKLAFTHTPDMLDPFSLKLYRFLQRVIASERRPNCKTDTITAKRYASTVNSSSPIGRHATCSTCSTP